MIKINGITAPIAKGSLSRSPVDGKKVEKGIRGDVIITNETPLKQEISFSTPWMKPNEGKAIEKLADGEGHCFPFDEDLYSTKGFYPEIFSNVSIQDLGAKFENHCEILNPGQLRYVFANSVKEGNYSEYSVMFWLKPNGGQYNHYAILSSGQKYLNGVSDNELDVSFFSFANEILDINNSTGVNIYIDDLVVLPFLLTDTMIKEIYEKEAAFSQLPFLNIEFIGKEQKMSGKIEGIEYKEGGLNGQWHNDLMKLKIVFTEV